MKPLDKTKNDNITELLLIFSPVFLYVFFHSFLWWKRAGGSLGLVRVLAGIMPLVAITGLKGWNFIQRKFQFNHWLKRGLTAVLVFFFVKMTISSTAMPVPLRAGRGGAGSR
ncbi:MAG: hypothetical protein M3R27_04785 [Bacteroidota bacterium]|nr:hypothetical protein [Bacteroidota bacterium]